MAAAVMAIPARVACKVYSFLLLSWSFQARPAPSVLTYRMTLAMSLADMYAALLLCSAG